MIFTMIASKKYYLIILFVISCSIQTIAQTGYYYKGKKIPLFMNDDKICVSIPKEDDNTCEIFLANVKVLEKIYDEKYNIFVILRAEYENLSSSDSWRDNTKSVITTSVYNTINGTDVYSSPYINIRLKKEEDIDLLTSYTEQYGLEIVKQNPLMPLWFTLAMIQDNDKKAIDYANELWESGKFAASVPDLCSNEFISSNDPLYNQQWGLFNSSNPGIDISAPSTWNYSTGKNVKIAIIDTGVYLNQIDLAPNISDSSYDTVTGTSPSVVYDAHATHCAGIAAAVKDNDIQVAGVAPDATIISISNHPYLSNPYNLANGIVWACQNGADIISNSWHTDIPNPAIEEAINYAFQNGRNGKGCIVVFASGNEDFGVKNVKYPANCNDTILAVGAIDNTGIIADYSCYGLELDLVAPGVSILSTFPNGTGYLSGTSMACPHVAGVAAMILQRNSELTVNEVNSIINSNAKKLSGVYFNYTKPDGFWSPQYGYGLVDAYSSVINTPSTVYIQNETITGIRNYSAGSIIVGSDVTDSKPNGEVILGQGNITLSAEYVEIKNSTAVPLGTTLTIGN